MTAVSSLDHAVNHYPHKLIVCNSRAVMEIRMDETDEAGFVSVSSGTVPAFFGFKTFFTATTIAATAVIGFGTWICTYLVQFRGPVEGSTQLRRPLVVNTNEEKSESGPYVVVSDAGKENPELVKYQRAIADAKCQLEAIAARATPKPPR